MAYFLKKSNLKKGLYLQIYESFYNQEKKQTAHRSHEALGYVENLISAGIEDPISHFSMVVHEMNEERKIAMQKEKEKQISFTPERNVGHFLLKAVYDALKVTKLLESLQVTRSFPFSISLLIEALTYSRVIDPYSKVKASKEVLPNLFFPCELSSRQIVEGIEYIGSEYEKIIEIFNRQRNLKYSMETQPTYFANTNFYFEITKEEAFQRKGASKENRKDLLVGLGLLLDSHQIPIGMKLFHGNESEKTLLRKVIQDMKGSKNLTGRTIQVAKRNINCANSILIARQKGGGYLFSKSVKCLPEAERKWVLFGEDYFNVVDKKGKILYKIKECVDKFPYKYSDENGRQTLVKVTEKRVVVFNPQLAEEKRYEIKRMVEKAKTLKAAQAKKVEFGECSKYVTFTLIEKKEELTEGKITVSLNEKAIEDDLKLAGYNLFVTSETNMAARDVYATCRNLWRMEDSFKAMKSYLDAWPKHLHKIEFICGHFLICYMSVLLVRILQLNVLDNHYCTENLIDFIKDFRVVEVQQNKFINITPASEVVESLSDRFALPLTNYFLDSSQIKKILGLKL